MNNNQITDPPDIDNNLGVCQAEIKRAYEELEVQRKALLPKSESDLYNPEVKYSVEELSDEQLAEYIRALSTLQKTIETVRRTSRILSAQLETELVKRETKRREVKTYKPTEKLSAFDRAKADLAKLGFDPQAIIDSYSKKS